MRRIIFIFAAVLMALMTATSTRAANEAYAVYTQSSKTLTFKYGTKPTTGTVYSLNQGYTSPGWIVDRKPIEKVVFDSSFATAKPTSTNGWFSELSALTTITGFKYLDTSNVTYMNSMFFNCSSLTSLDLRTFNTQEVEDMSGMFSGCEALESLDVSSFNTENVVNMSYMFNWCSSLKSLNLTIFNTSKVTDMRFMFYHCESLETLMFNKAKFITDNVTNMSYMFSGCEMLRTLDLTGFNTAKVTDMSFMFNSCNNLTTLDVSSFNTSEVTTMEGMFANCSNLTALDVSSFNTANVTNMLSMFGYCNSLTRLSLTNFNTENAESIGWMFSGCLSLTSIDISSFDTRNVTEMSYMFADCNYLETIEVGDGWNTDKVTSSDSEGMFNSCFSLVGGMGTVYDSSHTDKTYARIDGGTAAPGYLSKKPEAYAVFSLEENNHTIYRTFTFYYDDKKNQRKEDGMEVFDFQPDEYGNPSWYDYQEKAHIENVEFKSSFAKYRPTTTKGWFYNFWNVSYILGIEYLNTSEVTDMSSMFDGCFKLTSLDLSLFDTRNVTDMYLMFSGCQQITSLDLSNFDTRNVEYMGYMFYDTGLTQLDLSNFDTGKVQLMNDMFDTSSQLKTVDLSSFNTSNVTDMSSMFNECSRLETIYVGNGWNTNKVNDSYDMFNNCYSLKGGMGTVYDSSHTDKTYARIDGNGGPGYFTAPVGGLVTNIEAADSPVEKPSAPLYNLQGQRVSQPVKGQIYIQGGKKVRF